MRTCTLCRRNLVNPSASYALDCEHEFHVLCLAMRFSSRCPTCAERFSNEDLVYFERIIRGDVAVLEDRVSGDDSGYDGCDEADQAGTV